MDKEGDIMSFGAIILGALVVAGRVSTTAEPARPPVLAKAPPRVKDLVFIGTVIEIVQRHEELSLKNWAVTVTVDRIVFW